MRAGRGEPGAGTSAAGLLRILVSGEVLLVAGAIFGAALLTSLAPPPKALAGLGAINANVGKGGSATVEEERLRAALPLLAQPGGGAEHVRRQGHEERQARARRRRDGQVHDAGHGDAAAGLQPPRAIGPARTRAGTRRRWSWSAAGGSASTSGRPAAIRSTSCSSTTPSDDTRTTETSNVGLKLAAALVAFAAGIGAVVTVLVLAHQTPSAGSTSSSPQAAAAPTAATEAAFPSPPANALALAQEDRDLAVGLAVSPRGSKLGLQASVVGQESPAEGLEVAFRLPGRPPVAAPRRAAPAATAPQVAAPAPRRVGVSIRGRSRPSSTVSFPLPASVPGQPAAALVRRAEKHLAVAAERSSSTTASPPGPGTRSRRCGASRRPTASRTRSATARRRS